MLQNLEAHIVRYAQSILDLKYKLNYYAWAMDLGLLIRLSEMFGGIIDVNLCI